MAKFDKDWFGRRADDSYTHYNPENRLFGWDRGRKNYSSFLLGEGGNLKSAARLLGSMFSMIGADKKKMTPKGTKNEDFVQVPLAMLKEEDGSYSSDNAKADAFYGAALQNASLAALQTRSEYKKSLEAMDTGKDFNLKKFMYNLLNTERVGKQFGQRYPGYTRFVQKFKDHQYDEKYVPVAEDAEAHIRLLDLVTRMIRYPKHVTEEELAEFEKPINSIAKVLDRTGGLPRTSEECDATANSLSRIITEYMPDPPEDEEQNGPGEGEGEGDEGEEGEDGEGKGGGGGMGASSAKSKRKEELEEKARELTDNMIAPESGEDMSEEEKKELEKQFKEFEEKMKPEDKDEAELKSLGITKHDFLEWTYPRANKNVYRDALSEFDMAKANALRNLFKRKAKDVKFVVKGMKSGRFDTNKLAEARQGVSTVYERLGDVKTNKICVGVLIDESGSMSGTKIKRAREAAIFINEVFGKQRDVDLFVYGHTADNSSVPAGFKTVTNMHVYREPGKTTSQWALGSVRSHSNNRDGYAILATARKIRTFTQNPGILIVISDGAPAAQNYSNGESDTREKVLLAEKLGFQVVQIAIEGHVPSERMFKHYIKMTNMKSLPGDLIKYMSRRVDRMIKETVSL